MSPAIPFEERLNPKALLCVGPFILWFLLASFLPDTMTPKPMIFDVPVRGADLLILFAALVAFAGWLCAGELSPGRPHWRLNLPLWVSLLLAYAAASVIWSNMDVYNSRGMWISLCFAAAAFVLPFSVVASLSPEQVRSVTRLTALGIAFTGAVYSMESFIGLGLRSELGRFYSVGFGIERVKGPLFESSTGYIVLIPAAAVLLQSSFETPRHRLIDAAGLLALSISLLGLGSRFALVVTGAFVVSIALSGRSPRSFNIAAVTLAMVALSAGFVFQYASPDRLWSFQDEDRLATHATSLRAISERSPALSLSGSGYGSFWPWYLPDLQQADRISRGDAMRATDYGATLYQPHSVLLLVTVELGAVGLLFFVKLWSVLSRLVSRSVARQENCFAAVGVACAALGMFTETILFKGPKISAIWWFFLLAALAIRDSSKEALA